MDIYKNKYLKYKSRYLSLKNQRGGTFTIDQINSILMGNHKIYENFINYIYKQDNKSNDESESVEKYAEEYEEDGPGIKELKKFFSHEFFEIPEINIHKCKLKKIHSDKTSTDNFIRQEFLSAWYNAETAENKSSLEVYDITRFKSFDDSTQMYTGSHSKPTSMAEYQFLAKLIYDKKNYASVCHHNEIIDFFSPLVINQTLEFFITDVVSQSILDSIKEEYKSDFINHWEKFTDEYFNTITNSNEFKQLENNFIVYLTSTNNLTHYYTTTPTTDWSMCVLNEKGKQINLRLLSACYNRESLDKPNTFNLSRFQDIRQIQNFSWCPQQDNATMVDIDFVGRLMESTTEKRMENIKMFFEPEIQTITVLNQALELDKKSDFNVLWNLFNKCK